MEASAASTMLARTRAVREAALSLSRVGLNRVGAFNKPAMAALS